MAGAQAQRGPLSVLAVVLLVAPASVVSAQSPASLGVDVTVDFDEAVEAPGATHVFAVSVRNAGDVADAYSLVASGVPSGWTARYFLDAAISVPSLAPLAVVAGGTTTVYLAVTSRLVSAEARFDVSIRATSTIDLGVFDDHRATVYVSRSSRADPYFKVGDLQVSPSSVTDGTEVTFSLLVRNKGNAPAENLQVRLALDDPGSRALLGPDLVIARVASHASTSVQVKWHTGGAARPAAYVLHAIADPNDLIDEVMETDNRVASPPVRVSPRSLPAVEQPAAPDYAPRTDVARYAATDDPAGGVGLALVDRAEDDDRGSFTEETLTVSIPARQVDPAGEIVAHVALESASDALRNVSVDWRWEIQRVSSSAWVAAAGANATGSLGTLRVDRSALVERDLPAFTADAFGAIARYRLTVTMQDPDGVGSFGDGTTPVSLVLDQSDLRVATAPTPDRASYAAGDAVTVASEVGYAFGSDLDDYGPGTSFSAAETDWSRSLTGLPARALWGDATHVYAAFVDDKGQVGKFRRDTGILEAVLQPVADRRVRAIWGDTDHLYTAHEPGGSDGGVLAKSRKSDGSLVSSISNRPFVALAGDGSHVYGVTSATTSNGNVYRVLKTDLSVASVSATAAGTAGTAIWADGDSVFAGFANGVVVKIRKSTFARDTAWGSLGRVTVPSSTVDPGVKAITGDGRHVVVGFAANAPPGPDGALLARITAYRKTGSPLQAWSTVGSSSGPALLDRVPGALASDGTWVYVLTSARPRLGRLAASTGAHDSGFDHLVTDSAVWSGTALWEDYYHVVVAAMHDNPTATLDEGIVRAVRAFGGRVGEAAVYRFLDPNGAPWTSTVATLDAHGQSSAAFTVPSGAPSGAWSAAVTYANGGASSTDATAATADRATASGAFTISSTGASQALPAGSDGEPGSGGVLQESRLADVPAPPSLSVESIEARSTHARWDPSATMEGAIAIATTDRGFAGPPTAEVAAEDANPGLIPGFKEEMTVALEHASFYDANAAMRAFFNITTTSTDARSVPYAIAWEYSADGGSSWKRISATPLFDADPVTGLHVTLLWPRAIVSFNDPFRAMPLEIADPAAGVTDYRFRAKFEDPDVVDRLVLGMVEARVTTPAKSKTIVFDRTWNASDDGGASWTNVRSVAGESVALRTGSRVIDFPQTFNVSPKDASKDLYDLAGHMTKDVDHPAVSVASSVLPRQSSLGFRHLPAMQNPTYRARDTAVVNLEAAYAGGADFATAYVLETRTGAGALVGALSGSGTTGADGAASRSSRLDAAVASPPYGTWTVGGSATVDADAASTLADAVTFRVVPIVKSLTTRDGAAAKVLFDRERRVNFDVAMENGNARADALSAELRYAAASGSRTLDLGAASATADGFRFSFVVPAGALAGSTATLHVDYEDGAFTAATSDGASARDALLRIVSLQPDATLELGGTTVGGDVRNADAAGQSISTTRRPAAAAAFRVTVENEGNGAATFDLALSGPNASWVTLDDASLGPIAAGASASTDLTIEAPAGTPAGSIADVLVTVTARENASYVDAVRAVVSVDQVFAWSWSPATTSRDVDPGVTARHEFTLTNDGNGDDEVTVSVSGTRGGWTVTDPGFADSLAQGESRAVALDVTSATDAAAGDSLRVTITAASGGASAAAAAVTTTNQVFGLDLEVDGATLSAKSTPPAETAAFNVDVTNDGNGDDDFNVTWSSSDADYAVELARPGGAGVPSSGGTITLARGASERLTLRVTPPAGEPAGSVATVTLNAVSGGGPSRTVTAQTTTEAAFGLSLTPVTGTALTPPGSSASFDVTVTNTGNADDSIDLSLDTTMPSGWTATLSAATVGPLAPTGTAVVTLTVNVPAGALAGTSAVVRVRGTSQGDAARTDESTFTVTTDQVFAVEISPPTASADVLPGDTSSRAFTITNEGNGADTVSVTVEGLPAGWSGTASPASLTLTAGASGDVTIAVTAPEPAARGATATATVRASSVGLVSDTSAFTLTVLNAVPVANAGPDQTVGESAAVTLDGSGSTDPNGDALTFAWAQTAGPTVTLDGASSATPSFTSPSVFAATTLTFRLTVTDPEGLADADDVDVAVSNDVNEPPTANAGADATTGEGVTVALDGTASSDPNAADGDSIAFSWRQTEGPIVRLDGAATATPSFTSPTVFTETVLRFALTVEDEHQATDADEVAITVVNDVNEAPTANAGGDLDVGEATTVTLDGSGSSDPNGDAITFSWSQTSGRAVTLTGANSASPAFTAPRVDGDQNLVFRLVVSDGSLDSAPDDVTVLVRDSLNELPIADFAWTPESPTDLEDAAFTDRSSDPDGHVVAWSWNFGDGKTSSDDDPVHRFADDGSYTVTLTVTDNRSGTASASKVIVVRNVGPTAAFAFAPTSPLTFDDVQMDDRSTDPDGTIADWRWDFGDGTASTLAEPAKSWRRAGAYTITLTVTDDDGATATASATITVRNRAPTAAFVIVNAPVVRNEVTRFRDESVDVDGSIATWSWTFGDGGSATIQNPDHTYTQIRTVTITLTVTDDLGSTGTASKTVTVVRALVVDVTMTKSEYTISEVPTGVVRITYVRDGSPVEGADVVVDEWFTYDEKEDRGALPKRILKTATVSGTSDARGEFPFELRHVPATPLPVGHLPSILHPIPALIGLLQNLKPYHDTDYEVEARATHPVHRDNSDVTRFFVRITDIVHAG